MRILTIIILLIILMPPSIYSQYNLSQRRKIYSPAEFLKILNAYRTLGSSFSYESISPKKSINDSVKRKLLSLLKNEWTSEELKIKMEEAFKEKFEFAFFNTIRGNSYKIAEQLYSSRFDEFLMKSKRDSTEKLSTQYHKLYDSIFNVTYDSMRDAFNKKTELSLRGMPVNDNIVLGIAFAEIKEGIIIIQKDLDSDKHLFNPSIAQLALAKLGQVKYQKILLDKHQAYTKNAQGILDGKFHADLIGLRMVGTQESISLITDWLDTSRLQNTSNSNFDRRPMRYFYPAGYVVEALKEIIKNKDFHDGYLIVSKAKDIQTNPDNISLSEILYVKKWMLANKGKYLFD